MTFPLPCLGLFIFVLGIDFGAGLYEARIEVPRWLKWSKESAEYTWDATAAREADVGRRFWVFVSTLPLTILTIAGLVLAQSTPDPARTWWNVALGITAFERAFTFTFFIPTMIRLTADDVMSNSKTVAIAVRWRNLNGLRLLLTLSSWIAASGALYLLETSLNPR